MGDGTSSRSDRRWLLRYERAQRSIERAAAQQDHTALGRPGPALVAVDDPQGVRFDLRLVAPGEPVEHEAWFNLGATIATFVSRGAWTPEADNSQWVVVVERQRGPWRNFDIIRTFPFRRAADAAAHLQRVREALEAGRPIPEPSVSWRR